MKRFAGVGVTSRATTTAVLDALARLEQPVDAIAVPGHRADHPAVQAAAETLGKELHIIAISDLAGVPTPTQSARSLAVYGTGSIAEAAALAAAGSAATLLVHRVVSADRMATAALAKAKASTTTVQPEVAGGQP